MVIRLVIGLAMLLLLSAPAQAVELVVGMPTTARPFTTVGPDGRLSGFNADLAEMLCRALPADCRIEPAPFPKLLAGIAEGRFDMGIGNVLKTPERERQMLFSRPIWRSTSSLIAAKGQAVMPPDEAVRRHPVCVVQNTQQAAWVGRLAAANVVPEAGFKAVFEGLRAGRCALALMPTVNALEFLTSADGAGFDYHGPPLDEPSLGGTVHIVLPPDRGALRDAVDAALERMMLDGSYRALISRYFPFDIL